MLFEDRHIGLTDKDQHAMLQTLGYADMASFIKDVVPENILQDQTLALGKALTETEALQALKKIAAKNKIFTSYIGQGYYNTITPNVILRNILENPAWYTAYTPYQPEISQGRLEAILNYQTVISDLTGLEIANASMLDEGTAAAEAMTLSLRQYKPAKGQEKSRRYFVDQHCLPQTIDIILTRALPMGIDVVIGDPVNDEIENVFGVLLQYPGVDGEVRDFSTTIKKAHAQHALVTMAADIMALVLLKSPAELGADIAVGNTQRFGVPLGFGGPHAAYMATTDKHKRALPGRLVGVSKDSAGNPAYRLALQTREQHIRREKATSNICTAQVLLAVIASMYAVYHGPHGLRKIAQTMHQLSNQLAGRLKAANIDIINSSWFDTLTIKTDAAKIQALAASQKINVRIIDENHIGIAIDETTTEADIIRLTALFTDKNIAADEQAGLSKTQLRSDSILQQDIFNSHHSETLMLRYLRKLADKDIALDRAMIPLGSCTMKLNATAEMIPVTWPEFGAIHPLAPLDQSEGYQEMIAELEAMLCVATGYDAISLQPNAGSQGEYAGLLAIHAYHQSRGDTERNVCLIPASAHGTNPASAQMCGMKVVVVKCDSQGNIDIADLTEKAEKHSANLAAIMITYPSTHGVFEAAVTEVCDIVHQHGGQVYIDGANLNAMVGLCSPGQFGGDVSHLNLHKTFCIPHGGGGPGVGPVAVGEHLKPFLPDHFALKERTQGNMVSAAPWGSASILPISWMYIKMMGAEGLRKATEAAILNANYIAKKLANHYPVLYTGKHGLVAHECILDIRPINESTGISVDDIAKRLIDFGFHAPTMSFPVAGTLMIEPTESESVSEIDRFIEAMIEIKKEIEKVQAQDWPENDNPLVNAPHTAQVLLSESWSNQYSRETAAYPVASLRDNKYWVPVGRVDNVFGDKNLICTCAPIEAYE